MADASNYLEFSYNAEKVSSLMETLEKAKGHMSDFDLSSLITQLQNCRGWSRVSKADSNLSTYISTLNNHKNDKTTYANKINKEKQRINDTITALQSFDGAVVEVQTHWWADAAMAYYNFKEGFLTGFEQVLDGLMTGAAVLCGWLGFDEAADAIGRAVDYEIVGNYYDWLFENDPWMKLVEKHSTYNHDDPACDNMKGFGTIASYIAMAALTGGALSSLGVSGGMMSGLSSVLGDMIITGIGTLGAETDNNLEAGMNIMEAAKEASKDAAIATVIAGGVGGLIEFGPGAIKTVGKKLFAETAQESTELVVKEGMQSGAKTVFGDGAQNAATKLNLATDIIQPSDAVEEFIKNGTGELDVVFLKGQGDLVQTMTKEQFQEASEAYFKQTGKNLTEEMGAQGVDVFTDTVVKNGPGQEGFKSMLESMANSGSKETVQSATNEFTQSVSNEFVQSMSNESGQLLLTDGSQTMANELAQTMTNESGQLLLTDGSQTIANEFAQTATNETMQTATNEITQQVTTKGTNEFAQNTIETFAGESLEEASGKAAKEGLQTFEEKFAQNSDNLLKNNKNSLELDIRNNKNTLSDIVDGTTGNNSKALTNQMDNVVDNALTGGGKNTGLVPKGGAGKGTGVVAKEIAGEGTELVVKKGAQEAGQTAIAVVSKEAAGEGTELIIKKGATEAGQTAIAVVSKELGGEGVENIIKTGAKETVEKITNKVIVHASDDVLRNDEPTQPIAQTESSHEAPHSTITPEPTPPTSTPTGPTSTPTAPETPKTPTGTTTEQLVPETPVTPETPTEGVAEFVPETPTIPEVPTENISEIIPEDIPETPTEPGPGIGEQPTTPRGDTGSDLLDEVIPGGNDGRNDSESTSMSEQFSGIEGSLGDIVDLAGGVNIPTSADPIRTKINTKDNKMIPLMAGLGAAAVAGLGTKAYLERKENKDEEEEIEAEEWEEDEDLELSLVNDNIDLELEESDYLTPTDEYAYAPETADIESDDEGDKYEAVNSSELPSMN